MYKVRIDVEGWEHYTGLLGTIPFENGVSTRVITEQEASRLGASLRVVKVGSDEQIGASTIMVNSRRVSAEVVPALQSVEETPEEVELKYTKDQLEEIASEGGIKAVREVAKEFGVKGVEISKMIDDVMAVQLGTEKE